MAWISTRKHRGPPIFMANDYFMKVNDIGDKLMGSEGHPTPVMHYQAGYAEKGYENGLNMVRHTALFYSEESLLEYLNGETKSMVEELAAMQDHGVAYVIRRDNEISEDPETLFRNMHPSIHFKFSHPFLAYPPQSCSTGLDMPKRDVKTV